MTLPRYNRVMKFALAVLALLLAACSKNVQTTDAVRQAVVDDIKIRAGQTGLKMDAMDVSVSSVSFATNEARATVAFSPKGMPPGSGMSMDYVLARKGDAWSVTSRQLSGRSGGVPGGGLSPGQLPPGHPGTESKQ